MPFAPVSYNHLLSGERYKRSTHPLRSSSDTLVRQNNLCFLLLRTYLGHSHRGSLYRASPAKFLPGLSMTLFRSQGSNCSYLQTLASYEVLRRTWGSLSNKTSTVYPLFAPLITSETPLNTLSAPMLSFLLAAKHPRTRELIVVRRTRSPCLHFFSFHPCGFLFRCRVLTSLEMGIHS